MGLVFDAAGNLLLQNFVIGMQALPKPCQSESQTLGMALTDYPSLQM